MSKPRRVGRRMIRERNGNMRRKFNREVEITQWWADFTGSTHQIYRVPYGAVYPGSPQYYTNCNAAYSPFFPVLYCAMTIHPQKEVTHE